MTSYPTEEIFRIAEEALKEISLSELDMLTDYVPETKHIDKEGLILDMSAHEGLEVGLPYNLDFIVRRN